VAFATAVMAMLCVQFNFSEALRRDGSDVQLDDRQHRSTCRQLRA